MWLPSLEFDPELYFNQVAKIAKKKSLSQLSMGMSGDFKVAIRFGATYVRIGTAIFGKRV